MPLDEFQKSILDVVRGNRDRHSVFAGGAVIQQHGMRLSDDQDIFTDAEPGPVAEIDMKTLRDAGFTVELLNSYNGFRECRVSKPKLGTTLLQWTCALSHEYFAPVPDPLFGQRLHFADLAANKAQAAATRMVIRDFVDLWMLDQHVMPLWRMACAASGKFPQESPLSLVSKISFNLNITMSKTKAGKEDLFLTMEIPDNEPSATLHNSITEAELVLPVVHVDCLGKLQLDKDGHPTTCRKIVSGGNWIDPKVGGAMPSFAGTDSEMIAELIAEYGPEGSRHTGGEHAVDEGDIDLSA